MRAAVAFSVFVALLCAFFPSSILCTRAGVASSSQHHPTTKSLSATKEEIVQYMCGKPEAFSGISTNSHCAVAMQEFAHLHHLFANEANNAFKCPAFYSTVFGAALGLRTREAENELVARDPVAVKGFKTLLERYITATRDQMLPGGGFPSFKVGYYTPTLAQLLLSLVELWLVGFATPYGQIINGYNANIPYAWAGSYVPANLFNNAQNWKPQAAAPGTGQPYGPVPNGNVGLGYLNLFQQAANAWQQAAAQESQDQNASLNAALDTAYAINPFPSGRSMGWLRDIAGINGADKQGESFGMWSNQALVTVCSCMCSHEN